MINLNTELAKRFYHYSQTPEERSMYITPSGRIMVIQDSVNPQNDIAHSFFDIVILGNKHLNEHGIEFVKEGYVRCRLHKMLTYICITTMPNETQLDQLENIFSTTEYDVNLIDFNGRQVLIDKADIKGEIINFLRGGE